MFQFGLVLYINLRKLIYCCVSGFLPMPTWLICIPKMGHHICIIIIDVPSCMMTMMMTRTAINIFTRYWTFCTYQSPILQGRVLDLIKLSLLWELAPRCYQLPQVRNIVENLSNSCVFCVLSVCLVCA